MIDHEATSVIDTPISEILIGALRKYEKSFPI